MTTIGTAVLQIIPSLLGVSEEIEKQIDGKVVEVKIEPTVDKRATEKAGKDAGDTIVKETKEAVRKGDIGKTVADEVQTSARSGGLRQSAAEAAGEFGKGFLEGMASELKSARIGNVLEGINTQVRTTTNLIQGIGGVTGIDVSPIVSASDTISGAIGEIQTAAANTKTQVDSVITPLQTFGELAGPDSKLYKATGKLPLIGQFIELVPALREGNSQLEGIVQKYTGLNVPLSGESWIRYLTDNGAKFNSAADNAQQKLADAQAAAAASGAPVRSPIGNMLGNADGGMIPGFSTKDDRLGFLPGGGAIGLAGGEGIVKATATRKLGGKPFIDFLNGFADGGVVGESARDFAHHVKMPFWQKQGLTVGDHAADKYGEHQHGALDIMVGSIGAGQNVLRQVLSDPSVYGAIFNNQTYGYGHGLSPKDYSAGHTGDPNQDHTNHVHVWYKPGGNNNIPGTSQTATHPAASSLDTSGGGAKPYANVSSGGASAAPSSAGSGGGGSSSSSSISLPSSLSGFGAFAGEQIGDQLGDKKLGKLASSAGSLIDGQVSSALDVFGIPGSPGWLQGISTLVGGIKIGGGSSASPLAASQKPYANVSPGDAGNMHGTRSGQAPGPTYNITARDTEDAFVKAQRVERERAAAKLNRF